MQHPVPPIRRMLMQMIFLSCGAVLGITITAFLGYELLTFRQSSVQYLQTLSRAIASNSTAALAFDNRNDAIGVLAAFSAEPHINAAALYDGRGEVFATWPENLESTTLPPPPAAAGYQFTRAGLQGFEPVIEKGKPQGMLYVRYDLRPVYQRLLTYSVITLLVTALSLLVAWLISRRLQHRFLRPIHALTHTARAVSDRNDYTVRAVRTGTHEFDVLTDAFNHMLQQIQASEHRLQAQLGRIGLLQHITRAIGDRQDLPSIHQVVLGTLEQNMRVAFTCIMQYETSSGDLTVGAFGPASQSLATSLGLSQGMSIPVQQNRLATCLAGELVNETDTSTVDLPLCRRFAAAGLQSLVVTPLMVENGMSGALLCARESPQAFSSSDCEFLRQLGEHVALATHQMRLHESLQQAYDDLRQSQLTVLQQERLRALGQMASGISHDINNAISPVSLYTEVLLERETGLSERARGYLVTIQKAIEDVARTVSRMREFYRERETQLTLERVDLNRAIEQVVNLTRPRWSDQPLQRGIVIDLRTALAPDLPDVMGADNEIRDALTNLLFNAVDAMPNGGTLTIRTAALTRQEVRYSSIEVSDTGIGMDDDTRRRCLEPFYTTKGERGTGLGLAMVYGMIQRHSAELEIESTPGQGTTMRLVFAAAGSMAADSPRPSSPQVPARSLHILLVDDDPLLIQSLQDSLQEDGHMVTATLGGQAGIDTFTKALRIGQPFDLAITDLGMPFVDGRKVAAAIKALSSSTPVILLTGWGQRLIAESDTPEHVDKVLSKPPRLQELRAAFVELAP